MSVRVKYIYRAYRYRFRVDPAEVRFVRRSLHRGQVALDIGCHKGAYTYWMRRRVGPAGAVYAFEPQPRQVAYLREAFSAMHYDNVEVVPMAVSDKRGELPLYTPDISTHFATLELKGKERGGTGDMLVDVTTLDDFFADNRKPPHFLKIDVEGHELAVLAGGRRTLELHHPTILVECEARHRVGGDVFPVFELLKSLGYTGSFFREKKRLPLAEFDPAEHQRLDPSSEEPLPGYANNFAFEYAKKG